MAGSLHTPSGQQGGEISEVGGVSLPSLFTHLPTFPASLLPSYNPASFRE